MAHKRYHLQRRERTVLPNVLGNHSMPVYTYRWKTIAVCDERKPLEDQLVYCAPQEDYRIEDTLAAPEGGKDHDNPELLEEENNETD